jgi:hypothetical protein
MSASPSWSQLIFTPSAESVSELRTSWSWCIGETFSPCLFTIFGDVFFELASDGVWWLNCGTAEITRVADSIEDFQIALATEAAQEWFLPELVGALLAEGKVPKTDECFTYAILPCFVEGRYETWNFKPVPAREHFGMTAEIHKQILNRKEGDNIQIKFVD